MFFFVFVRQHEGNVYRRKQGEDERLDGTGQHRQKHERELERYADEIDLQSGHESDAQHHHGGNQGVFTEDVPEKTQTQTDRLSGESTPKAQKYGFC